MDSLLFYKCLADQTRLTCLMLIQQEGELCVCELMEALQEGQPKVSRHLAQLRNAGLLTDRRQGQWVFYRIHPLLADWQVDILDKTHQNGSDFFQQSLVHLSNMRSRPGRNQACC